MGDHTDSITLEDLGNDPDGDDGPAHNWWELADDGLPTDDDSDEHAYSVDDLVGEDLSRADAQAFLDDYHADPDAPAPSLPSDPPIIDNTSYATGFQRTGLTPEQQTQLEEVAFDLTHHIPFCPIIPNPGPQTMFLLDFGKEALYGGAAGGGKSWAVLMVASQFLDIPGYACLILRKSFPDLEQPNGLMDVASTWWGGQPNCHYHAQKRTWRFDCPGGGQSKIVFGSLDDEHDRLKYQGGVYHCVIFDELTQHKERDYRYLFSRMRRVSDPDNPLSKIPIRMRATTNPGGPGHEWVYKRFIKPWEDWHIHHKRTRPKRNFHPSTIKDNPKLDQNEYIETLMELTPVEREQLMRGDWHIRTKGRMFDGNWFKVCRRSDVPSNCIWVRFWDMAGTDPDINKEADYTAGALVGLSPRGQYYILDMRHWRHEPAENDLMLMTTAYYDTPNVPVRIEEEPGASGKTTTSHYARFCFQGFDFQGIRASSRVKGRKVKQAAPVASQANAGNVYVVEGEWNEAFIDEVELFPDSDHDDQVDAMSGAFRFLAKQFNLSLIMGNETFQTEDSGWVPTETPSFTYRDISGHEAMMGKVQRGLDNVSELKASEIAARVESAFRM